MLKKRSVAILMTITLIFTSINCNPHNKNALDAKQVKWEKESSGKILFNTNCAPCHELDGTGRIGVAPSIRNRDFLALASDDFIKQTIIRGRPGTSMVARPDLSEQNVEDIIAYLRSFPVSFPLDIKVDTQKKYYGNAEKGRVNYTTYCAPCHGQKGEGYRAGAIAPGIGLKGFLDVACDDYIFQTVKYGRTGTAMKSFMGAQGLANLKKKEVYDIIAFLRKHSIE